jgi:hypothetical protein
MSLQRSAIEFDAVVTITSRYAFPHYSGLRPALTCSRSFAVSVRSRSVLVEAFSPGENLPFLQISADTGIGAIAALFPQEAEISGPDSTGDTSAIALPAICLK